MHAGERRIGIGRISGVFGVRGWVRIFSYTSPRTNVIRYGPWHLRLRGEETVVSVIDGQAQGESVVARLEGIDDRDSAARLVGAEIEVPREALGEAGKAGGREQYFWADLVGMEVRTVDGEVLGRIDHLFDTGSNDVMVIVGDRRCLVPFLQGSVVKSVDDGTRRVTVDWDPDF